MRHRACALFYVLHGLCFSAPGGLLAQEAAPFDGLASEPTREAAAAGVFLPHTDSPTTQTHRAAVNGRGGYDQNRGSGTADLRAELVILGGPQRRTMPMGLSLVGTASYFSPSAHAGYIGQGRVNASGGLKLQPLFQARHGFDGALSIRYVSQGDNLSPAIATGLLFARRFANTQLILNADYGQSFANGDRYGWLRAASLTRVIRELRLGVDGRASFDLGFEDDTPGEAAYDVTAGPVASYALSHLVFSLGGGPSLLRFTDKPGNGSKRNSTLLGFALHVGVGAAL
jgi:hypothetical protein